MTTTAPAPAKLTVDEFLAAYAGRAERFELIDGVPQMMAGASLRHALISSNLIWRLRERLQGGPCTALGSDMGLEVSNFTYRLPDVAIYCDQRDLVGMADDQLQLRHPKVIFEILSKSTEATDRGFKLDEYQGIESVDTIVFIHQRREAFTTFERIDALRWQSTVHLPGQPLVLREPSVTIAAAELFAGVR